MPDRRTLLVAGFLLAGAVVSLAYCAASDYLRQSGLFGAEGE